MFFRYIIIPVLFSISALLYAGGQTEDLIFEVQALMQGSADSGEQFIEDNLRAADILDNAIQGFSTSETIPEEQLAKLRLTLADAYFNAKDYDQAIIALSDVIRNHGNRFDEAEEKIAQIRAIREQYNTLLGAFLNEIEKDPNSPDDPFNENIAFGYITEMNQLFSHRDATIVEEIAENRARLKLAVDRGYRGRILDAAHEHIVAGDYIAAMDRYLTIQDIDSTGFYTRSFDLQREEFLNLQVSDLFVNQVDSIIDAVTTFAEDFKAESSVLERSVQAFLGFSSTLFPDNSANIPDYVDTLIGDFESTRSSLPLLDQVFTDVIALTDMYVRIEQLATRTRGLGGQLPSFLPVNSVEEDKSSEYLVYLEQFIAGPQQYEMEGISGASFRQLRAWLEQIKDDLFMAAASYLEQIDTAYESSRYEELPSLQDSYQKASEFILLFLSYVAQGEDLNRENQSNYLELLHPHDRRDAAHIFLERERVDGRVALSRFALNYNDLASNTYTGSEESINAYNRGVAIIAQIENYNLELQEGVGGYDLPLNEYRNQHDRDKATLRDAILGAIGSYIVNYLQQEQEVAQQLLGTAQSEFDEGSRELRGIGITTLLEGVETDDIRYYPGSALGRFVSAREDLLAAITIEESLVSLVEEGPDQVATLDGVPNSYTRVLGLLEESRDLLQRLNASIETATVRVDAAEQLIAEAREFQTNFRDASSQRDYDLANEYFAVVEKSYNDALNLDYRVALRTERDEVLAGLSAELTAILIESINAEKTAALNQIVSALSIQNYFLARNALEDAKEWDERLPTPPDPVIIAYEREIEQAILLSGFRDIPPINDSRYSRITNDLNEAGTSLARAQAAAARNDERTLAEEIARTRSFLASVRDQIPANFEAAFIDLQLTLLENPAGFDVFFATQVSEVELFVYGQGGAFASGEYSEYTVLEKDQLLSRIEALNELDRDSRLTQLAIAIEVDLGRRESPEIVAARNRANALVNQGRSLINSARRESNPTSYENLLNQALDRLRQAQVVFPRLTQTSALISEAEVLLGLEITVNLPFEANQAFEQAVALFVNQDFIGAKRLLDILWSNESYRSYFPLKELITELYNLLGQSLPGV